MDILFRKFDDAGIWHMPLKGAVLKEDYPAYGMRQMSDYDILYDADRAEDVKTIFEGMGFTCESFGKGVHDIFHKEPVSNFEMHRALFGAMQNEKLESYYAGIKKRLIRDREEGFGYHFRPEDFYVYMVAHQYKHYFAGGIGLRSVLDTYVYLKKRRDALDWDDIRAELEILGISEFERQNRILAKSLFGGGAPGDADEKMLDYVIFSGAYGTLNNQVKNGVERYGNGSFAKLRYVAGRLVLPLETVRSSYPLFIRYPVLLPFLPVFRLIRGMFLRRKAIGAELKTLVKYNPES